MAQSTRYKALDALKAALDAIAGPTVLWDETEPQTVPANGLIILYDGEPGEPDVTLSPLSYYYDHAVEIEVIIQASTPATRQEKMDQCLVDIANAIALDRTLGGNVEDTRTGVAEPINEPITGAADIKAMAVPITLSYETSDPLL